MKQMAANTMLAISLLLGVSLLSSNAQTPSSPRRSFTIDYEKNEFLKDGQVFRYVSGEMHYFRVPTELWRDRLRKMKFGGLNVVQTYIEWSAIERKPGVYDFSGNNNLTRFIKEAEEEGLLVILRPGPYICAERDMGGLPSWLLKASPNIKLRSSNSHYLEAVDRWMSVLLPRLRPLLYINGGPVIMVQLENEYGSFEKNKCDTAYTTQLRDIFTRHLSSETVLFTCDGNGHAYYKCGRVENVFSTIDFGILNRTNVANAFALLRRYQKRGPLVNSEFYSGWLDYWERPHQTRSSSDFSDTLDTMLSMNASVNIYMFHGGSNFGFSAGANLDPVFYPVPTNYDYDAPISEAGDLTEKFFAIKNVIKNYMPVPESSKSLTSRKKMHLPPIEMHPKATLFEVLPNSTWAKWPLSFEQLDHAHGFIFYSSRITFQPTDPAVLHIPDLHDRAQVFIDKEFAGTLSVTQKILHLPIHARNSSTIGILVENQGRIFYGPFINQRKGILSNVLLSGQPIRNWHHYRLFSNWQEITQRILKSPKAGNVATRIPTFFSGTFTLPDIADYPLDSFLQVTGWSKGVAFLNGYNLGRYWPLAGPQETLYAPSVFFKSGKNTIVLFEQERSPCSKTADKCVVQFVSKHNVNGTVPMVSPKKPYTFVQKET